MQYPGGKNQYGFYQKIINLIPPHQTYIETHLGSGSIMRRKKPAQKNIGIDIDIDLVDNFSNVLLDDCDIVNSDAKTFIENYNFIGNEFIYCDPPYLKNTRKSNRRLYKHEYSYQDHENLLELLTNLPCKIMISGYQSDLYAKHLKDWHSKEFQIRTRSGETATEVIWMNYPKPMRLHDYSYLGDNNRERERIKRKTQRWVKNLNMMPVLERSAILSAITPKGVGQLKNS